MLTIQTTGLEQYLEGGTGKVKLLIAGAPSSGKTVFGSWAPKPIYAATEDGLMSIAHRKIPFGRITSEDDMNAFLDLLEAECRKPPAQRRWGTVVIDTLDAYERTVVLHYLRNKRKAEMSGWEDWGYLSGVMNGLLGRLSLLDMNVIVLVHTKDVKLKGQVPEDQLVPRIKGEIRDQIMADFDFVGLLKVDWAGEEGERVLDRSIHWDPRPEAPWLKNRAWTLGTTEVKGTSEDFDVIQTNIAANLEKLEPSVLLQEQETPADTAPAPVEPVAGGPVTSTRPASGAPAQAVAAAKKAAAKAPAKKAVAASPAARPEPKVPVAAGVPAAPAPDLENPTEEQAVANVQNILGGTVVEQDGVPVEPTPDPEGANTVTPTTVDTPHVDEPEVQTDSGQVDTQTGEVTDSLDIPESGEVTVPCGTVRFPDGTPIANGCGNPIHLVVEENRIVGASTPGSDGPERSEMVEIGALRTRTVLHNACYAQYRRSIAS